MRTNTKFVETPLSLQIGCGFDQTGEPIFPGYAAGKSTR